MIQKFHQEHFEYQNFNALNNRKQQNNLFLYKSKKVIQNNKKLFYLKILFCFSFLISLGLFIKMISLLA